MLPQKGPRQTWGQLWRICISPGQAYAALAENHNWLPPWLVAGAVGTVTSLVAAPAMVRFQVALNQQMLEARGVAGTGNPETFAKIGAYFGAVLGPWLVTLFVALFGAFLLWIVSLIGRDHLEFGRLYGLTMWALFPPFLLSFLLQSAWLMNTPTAAVVAAGGRMNSNLTLLIPGLVRSGWAHRLLSTVDLFTIWTAVLVGVGYAAFSRKSGRRPILAGVLYWAGSAGLALVGSLVQASFKIGG